MRSKFWIVSGSLARILDCVALRFFAPSSICRVSACRIHSAASLASRVTVVATPRSISLAHVLIAAAHDASFASSSRSAPTNSGSYSDVGHRSQCAISSSSSSSSSSSASSAAVAGASVAIARVRAARRAIGRAAADLAARTRRVARGAAVVAEAARAAAIRLSRVRALCAPTKKNARVFSWPRSARGESGEGEISTLTAIPFHSLSV